MPGIQSVRYRNEKECRCRNQSCTGMKKNADAGTSPVSECSGTRLRCWMPEYRCRCTALCISNNVGLRPYFGARFIMPENTKQKFIHLEQTVGKYAAECNIIRFYFVYFFGATECVGPWATLLLMSPILYFREMYGFEPRELPQQAGALLT